MLPYHRLLRPVLERGTSKSDRTGTGTISIFGTQSCFSLEECFPLATTKKLRVKLIICQLLSFLRGDTKFLDGHGVTIWDEWADALFQFYVPEARLNCQLYQDRK